MNNDNRAIFKNSLVAAAGVIAVGFLLCAIIGSYALYSVRALDNQLSVTGSAKQEIMADRVKWTTTITRPADATTLKAGYAELANDLKVVTAYFNSNGFDASKLTVSSVFMDEVYDNRGVTDIKRYTLRQNIVLASEEVDKVDALSKNTQDVINKGVIFTVSPPEYLLSDLATLRVSLLSAALQDAKARAESISSMAGNRVGKLKSASSGVVQVLPYGSVDVSDYGTYDTSGIRKEVMVTVRASFNLR
jgi:uncharacterized protein